jgi:hypothetical protein
VDWLYLIYINDRQRIVYGDYNDDTYVDPDTGQKFVHTEDHNGTPVFREVKGGVTSAIRPDGFPGEPGQRWLTARCRHCGHAGAKRVGGLEFTQLGDFPEIDTSGGMRVEGWVGEFHCQACRKIFRLPIGLADR